MIRTGLLSVTFRELSPAEIVELVAQAELDGIEWGGDIHVPHGHPERAREVAAMTRDHGISVAAYGSYYRAGVSEAGGLTFQSVLDTALALDAPVIRVWAGGAGSEESTPEMGAEVRDDSTRIAELAANEGIEIVYEWHGGTLTDTLDSAKQLLADVSHPNVRTLWQPLFNRSIEDRIAEIEAISGRIANLHIYHWGDNFERMPLRDGLDVWRRYIEAVRVDGVDRYGLLEFVRDDSPDAFLDDAAALRELVNEIST